MSDTPRRKMGRSTTRRQRVRSMVDQKLSDARLALDVLLHEAAKGRVDAELWHKLHAAALRDDMILELSFAYDELLNRKTPKQVPPAAQVEFLAHAAAFSADILGDADGAVAYLERVLEVAPDNAAAFTKLESRFIAAHDELRLAELYASVAARIGDRAVQRQLVQKASTLVERFPSSQLDRAIRIFEQLVSVDLANAWFRRGLESRYLRARRFKDLAALLERVLAGSPAPDPAEVTATRQRLIVLYVGDARNPEAAIPHVEEILRGHPDNEEARKAAEQLLKHDAVAARAAAALQQRRRQLGSRPQ